MARFRVFLEQMLLVLRQVFLRVLAVGTGFPRSPFVSGSLALDDFLVARGPPVENRVAGPLEGYRAERAEVGRRLGLVVGFAVLGLGLRGDSSVTRELMTLQSYQRPEDLAADGAAQPTLVLVGGGVADLVARLLGVEA